MNMETKHTVYINKAQSMGSVESESVDIIVTSPPYPMIEMWDDIMSNQNPQISDALKEGNPNLAFELMHKELDKVWKECYRVLKNGGFACINIGDATRTIDGEFQLYNNHSRIVKSFIEIGFTNLPNIIWRKQTNAPNKFMGSGMLPCGAYVTLEHEWILIFRKGSKREYKTEKDKQNRRLSSFFWEERNVWFSDIWDIKGTKQKMIDSQSRDRSAAYPLELPYRLINMYSQRGDTVLDPFLGTGTTMQAAIIAERNSIGYEVDSNFKTIIKDNISFINIDYVNKLIKNRYDNHKIFVQNRIHEQKKEVKHFNYIINCEVMTKQETEMELHYLKSIYCNSTTPLLFKCSYDVNTNLEELPFYAKQTLF